MIQFLAAHGAQLAIGLSLFLTAALILGRLQRSPAKRHRWAEGVLMGVPLCAALLLVPMGRALHLAPDAPPSPHAPVPEGAESAAPGIGGEALMLREERTRPKSSPLFAIAFATGASLVLLYLLCGALFLARLVRGARELHVPSNPAGTRVVVARGARRPFCIGTAHRGLIVLPYSLAEAGREDQLEAVLAHERSHLEDGHGRARLLASALAPALFWNPAYWVLVARMRADAELCADDAAAQQVGTARYVRALLALVEDSPPQPKAASLFQAAIQAPVLGALAPARPFLQRMESLMLRSEILDRTVSPIWRTTSMAALACVVALVNAACGTTAARSAEPVILPVAVTFDTLALSGTDIGTALAKGDATDAPFPEHIQSLAGHPIAIDGYMIPLMLDDEDQVTEFLLLRDNMQCCMGGAPPKDHWVYARVQGAMPTAFDVGRRVHVEGTFELEHPSDAPDDGYTLGVYQLHSWNVRPAE